MEEYKTVIVASGAAVLAIVLISIVVALIRRRRRRRAMEGPLPLIPFSAGRGNAPARPDGLLSPAPHSPSSDFATARTPPRTETVPEANGTHPRSPYAPPPPPVEARVPVRQAAAPNNALADTALPNDLMAGEAVDGAQVRYWRPADGTLQFLPGRLEVIAGRDAGQEIRFVRTPGPDGTHVTFGRAEGAPYRHVQLREPTVSRAHARMTLEAAAAANPGRALADGGGKWRLENLSATNPVVVNGRALAADGTGAGSVPLGEGDRIEMGEVVFRFHEK